MSAKNTPTVCWARVSGFPWWPGRVSTTVEERLLTTPSQTKTKYVAITFFGTTISRGWATETSIVPFDIDSMSTKLQLKKLAVDRNYLDAVCEGIRIELSRGHEFPEEVMTTIEKLLGDPDWDREDVCLKCHGTEFSGDSLLCDRCERGEIHLHCLNPPLLSAPFGDWYCIQCCKELKLPEDYMPLDVTTPTTTAHDQPPSNKRRRGRPFNNPALNSPSISIEIPSPSTKNNKQLKENKKKKVSHLDESRVSLEDDYDPSSTTLFSRQTTGSREKSLETESTLYLYQKKLQEFCFICRVEENKCCGQLLSCDFPGCYRSYHTVCLAGRLSYFKYSSSSSSLDSHNPWFCPSHFCAICCSFEISKSKIYAYPLELLTLSLHLNPVDLQQCSTCPFSICYSCSSEITGHRGRKLNGKSSVEPLNGNSHSSSTGTAIFKNISTQLLKLNGIRSPHYAVMLTQLSKKTTTIRKSNSTPEEDCRVLCCLNCTSKEKKLSFARYLEELWMHVGTNKLSEPFLSPLLPFDPPHNYSTHQKSTTASTSSSSSSSSSVLTSDELQETPSPSFSSPHPSSPSSPSSPLDLYTILLKIRQLKYETNFEYFLKDIDLLSQRVGTILQDYFTQLRAATSQSSSSVDEEILKSSQEIILQSLSTVLFQIYNLPNEKKEKIANEFNHILLKSVSQKSGSIGLGVGSVGSEGGIGHVSVTGGVVGVGSNCGSGSSSSSNSSSGGENNSSSIHNLSLDDKLMLIWRRECNLSLTHIRELYLSKNYFIHDVENYQQVPQILPRSLASWCNYLSTSHLHDPALSHSSKNESRWNLMASNAVDALMELRSPSQLSQQLQQPQVAAGMTREETTSILHSRNPWENDIQIENDIIPTSYLERTSHGLYGKSVDLLDRLHEVTTTALHLQTQLKRDYLQRESLLLSSSSSSSSAYHQNQNRHPISTSSSSLSTTEPLNQQLYTIGEMHIIRELQLVNDNLRWRINQQSIELQKSANIIEKLSHENEKLAKMNLES